MKKVLTKGGREDFRSSPLVGDFEPDAILAHEFDLPLRPSRFGGSGTGGFPFKASLGKGGNSKKSLDDSLNTDCGFYRIYSLSRKAWAVGKGIGRWPC